ncbi:MAG: hypothetical protein H6742_01245 [Alphaproteobacteria bacterium]|nr:hypothetical protein [Alphaproteobacteria bacterium]
MRPSLPIPCRSALAGTLVLLGLAGCGGKQDLPTLTPADVGVTEVPAGVARLERTGPVRTYAGPARLEVVSQDPLHLRLEDYALAEPLELVVASRAPVTFSRPAGQLADDTGTFLEDDGKLLLSVERTWAAGSPWEGQVEQLVIVGRTAPTPIAPPRDWLASGTTLFYGLTLDDKPITRMVPMGVMVTVEDGADGSRVLRWQADVDPDMQVDDTTERYHVGVLTVPAELVESGATHADRFDSPGDRVADAGSLFLSRQARRTLSSMGAAAFADADVPDGSLLTAWGRLSVPLQADDALWSVPATVARFGDGRGTFVIADDAEHPLILSAKRPGSHLRLLAIGRPTP